ncbi:endolytic transglycosylase MltG [Oceanobacillus luteolus]|uniref:Endolytic murein transglycosylase n=1 Tax=Oceanobacillus luteolus TaxID=1274358 RepID=A0ABW4HX64_9BACI|nr:endolytic transglycosylase MltG [Oceanobacillus luteolus]MCM3738660.1 endolytic transglycosylase MltG [Oceanobacillus luteolus]
MSKGKFKKLFKENRNARGEEAHTVRKIVFIILIVFILLFAIGGVAGYSYVKSALEPVDENSEEKIDVEIPIGSSTSTIAGILEENGIIKNDLIFRFYIKFKNESDFQAGNYTFSPSMTIDEIIESLKSGKLVLESTQRVTIPEGLTVEQIAEIYSNHFSFTSEEFLEKVNDEEYIKQLIDEYPLLLTEEILHEDVKTPLEGYLYAITYDFYEENPSIESIVEMMLEQTQSVMAPYFEQIDEAGMTIHEAITFASIIEKETGKLDQRNEISGVFHNRLDVDMPLQTDPTVIYAKGEHTERVLYEDLEIESPYNTYKVKGLPVGPISNFAESSLEAVLNPVESDYLYFLHDRQGNIHFAETLEEHNQNKAEHLGDDE